MKQPLFLGRERELEHLNLLRERAKASLVVVRGRRRIGKSTLIEKFAEKSYFLEFAGLPPDEDETITAQDQRDSFARQLSLQFSLPQLQATDWADLFSLLAKHTKRKRVTILFDEITWMANDDPLFLAKLKNAWDLEFSKNPNLILVLCGSVSTWIEKNIVNSTSFYGRISLFIKLNELPLYQCHNLLLGQGFRRSALEELMILSVTGGVPWYLNHVLPKMSAEENIRRLCFQEDGILFNDFERIFTDIFEKRTKIYRPIVQELAHGVRELNDICLALNYPKSGTMSEYLDDLVSAGFITRDYTWLIKSGKSSRLSHYRLSDNYLRFYLKYIEPHRDSIIRGRFNNKTLSSLPGWHAIMGLQFENLVLRNREKIWQLLGVKPEDIVADNPYFQRKTSLNQGVQVDYLIQTRFNTLFAFEIKFSREPLGTSIIQECSEKMRRLTLPRGFSCWPVLIHVSGVQESVLDSGFFAHVIDFSNFLEE